MNNTPSVADSFNTKHQINIFGNSKVNRVTPSGTEESQDDRM